MATPARSFDAFTLFDGDGDGLVSAGDIVRAVSSAGLEITTEDAAAFVVAADSDGDHRISRAEFDAARAQKVSDGADEYTHAFHAFDLDGSGYLSLDEMEKLAAQCGYPPDSAAELMTAADRDGDGKLSLAEFTALMKTLNS
ncbi:EF-hand domain-containing protein [Nocardia sp. NPDC051321]|uniref:EF-hand domain-containing protein n=1 Tax=Nocardia sp. NPDC051321 TaxID=3364323 RepID=UPI0037B37D79